MLCREDQLEEGSALGFVVEGERGDRSVFAVRRDGQVFVYLNRCPHRGTELEMLENQFLDPDGAFIQCSTHGALFQVHDGRCVSEPCPGKRLTPLPFVVENGSIVLL